VSSDILPTPAHVDATAGLASRLTGALTTPGSPDWDAARRAWNLVADQQPVAVVHAATAEDVATTIRHAAATGTRVAVQATGHGAATLGPLDGAILLRTSALTDVAVDASNGRARVGAGALAGDLTAAAARHGLAFRAGSSPGVGVVGYTLGGGLGWLGRRYGFACNSVVAAEVVTADGRPRTVDAERDPDLFWALRGGGGAFAAVTALEVGLHPLREAYAGTLAWPLERAHAVLDAWRTWTGSIPDTVTSIARLLRYPPVPDLPAHLRGRELVAVEATFLDRPTEADRWLRPLRSLSPERDTFATVAVADLGGLHGDPIAPVPAVSDHRLLEALPEAAVEALLEVAGPGRSNPLLAVDLRHLGGALARSGADHGVLDRLDARYATFAVGVPMDAALADAIPGALAGLREALAPWDAGRG
jgi:FAD/FMN-containing dehydrogenase